MKRSVNAAQLVKILSKHGYRFKSFALQSTGTWTSDDADWNYKDVPHLNVVHTRVKAVSAAIDDAFIANIFLQKVAGIPMPIVVPNYAASDGGQVYFTSLLFFILVVDTRARVAEGAPDRTTVVTTYYVGSPRWLSWTFPLIRRLLSSNYDVLMSEDLPMRERRGELRRSGFLFRTDGRPRSFVETMDLSKANVEPPEPDDLPVEIDLAALPRNGGSAVVGSGPAGLRFIRNGDSVQVFDRVCLHEGASLDEAPLVKECLSCPWHGRLVRPLGTIEIGDQQERVVGMARGFVATVRGSRLAVRK